MSWQRRPNTPSRRYPQDSPAHPAPLPALSLHPAVRSLSPPLFPLPACPPAILLLLLDHPFCLFACSPTSSVGPSSLSDGRVPPATPCPRQRTSGRWAGLPPPSPPPRRRRRLSAATSPRGRPRRALIFTVSSDGRVYSPFPLSTVCPWQHIPRPPTQGADCRGRPATSPTAAGRTPPPKELSVVMCLCRRLSPDSGPRGALISVAVPWPHLRQRASAPPPRRSTYPRSCPRGAVIFAVVLRPQ